MPVKKDGLFQAVEINSAIRAALEVLPDFPAGSGSQCRVELFLKVPGHLTAC
jgi:hypothetical protein